MKLIDISIFCDIYEKELCLLKLKLENQCVDEFVWCENCYTYRGQYKGPILQNMINSDDRFLPYIDKIKVITVNKDFTDGNANLQEQLDPPQFHDAEAFLRNSSKDYILNKYRLQDRLIISDIDEMLDLTSGKRRDKIFGAFKEHDEVPIQFERVRYSFDFDNRSYRDSMDIVTPSYTVDNIITGAAKLSDKKWVGIAVPNGNNIAIFEYCFCFPYEGILAKYASSLHTKWIKQKIDQSIRTNTWTMTGYQTISKTCRWHWFDRVRLTPENSPEYVRENLASLKTNLVPDNYRKNRVEEFGCDAYPES